jgi:hypothetical protein
MKKMITALLAAGITFTGLGFIPLETQTVSADEIYDFHDIVSVLTEAEAAEINGDYEWEIGRKPDESQLLSAGDYKIDLFATGKVCDITFRWLNYDTDAVIPYYVPGETINDNTLRHTQAVSGMVSTGINVERKLITYTVMMSSNKKLNNKKLGTIYLKTLKPFDGNTDIFPTLEIHDASVQTGEQTSERITDRFTMSERTYNLVLTEEAANEEPETIPAEPNENAENAEPDQPAANTAVRGDTDGNGIVTIADAVLIFHCITEIAENGESTLFELADLNGDGFVDIEDVCIVLQELSKAQEA